MNIRAIEHIQLALKKDISKQIEKGNVTEAIELIDVYGDVTQKVNNILRDNDIESYIQQISIRYIKQTKVTSAKDDNTVIFYDQIGSTICLGLQYLRGLVANGYKVIYIFENGLWPIDNNLLEEVKTVAFKFYIFNTKKKIENGKFIGNAIRDTIIQFKPSKIIVHPSAIGALGMSVLYSIKDIVKYRIIPGDHHFFIGYDCFDFFIEFREYGLSNALYERSIMSSQLIYLPYYPIIDEFIEFEGFPEEAKGKLIFFASGHSYKYLGSNEFYDICKYILEFENTIVLYAGEPSKSMLDAIQNKMIADRFIFLGYRKDLVQCIINCDVFINSFPFSGGLVCQTAARFKKPIVAYSTLKMITNNAVEDILGGSYRLTDKKITFDCLGKLYKHIEHLVKDIEYREFCGIESFSLLQTEMNFNKGLKNFLEDSTPCFLHSRISKNDRKYLINLYLRLQNESEPNVIIPLLNKYKFFFPVRFIFLWKDIIKHPIYFLKYWCFYMIKRS